MTRKAFDKIRAGLEDAVEIARSQSMPTVWIYTDRRGDRDELRVFDSQDTAQAWFQTNDPEGVAFAYPVISSADDRRNPDRPQVQ